MWSVGEEKGQYASATGIEDEISTDSNLNGGFRVGDATTL
jgi:hypothetical protein